MNEPRDEVAAAPRQGGWVQVLKRNAGPLICIVHDDDSVRRRMDRLLRSVGSRTSVFDSSAAFLRSYHTQTISCLIVDADMTGVSGLRLQRMLADAHIPIPIVLVTPAADVIRAAAYAHGAVAVLRIPFTDKELLSAVTTALTSSERDTMNQHG